MSVSVLVSLATTVLVPAALLAAMVFARIPTRADGVVLALLALVCALAMMVVSPGWAWIGLHWRTVLLGGYAIALVVLVVLVRRRRWWRRHRVAQWVGLGIQGVVTAVFAVLLGLGVAGRSPPSTMLDLQVPLAEGRYYVFHGGASSVINRHAGVPAQRYAVDLVALNGEGRRAAGLAPDKMSAYAIYDRPVVAPCTGTVIDSRDGAPNTPLGGQDRTNPAGNHVTLHCRGHTVLLAHLAPDSVAVMAGEAVTAGQKLGRVGNTGNSTEPHLHIHAVQGRVTDHEALLRDADAVAVRFPSGFAFRNQTIAVAR